MYGMEKNCVVKKDKNQVSEMWENVTKTINNKCCEQMLRSSKLDYDYYTRQIDVGKWEEL